MATARVEELILIVCRIAREVSAQLGCAAAPS
jgi:hypothetical protein